MLKPYVFSRVPVSILIASAASPISSWIRTLGTITWCTSPSRVQRKQRTGQCIQVICESPTVVKITAHLPQLGYPQRRSSRQWCADTS